MVARVGWIDVARLTVPCAFAEVATRAVATGGDGATIGVITGTAGIGALGLDNRLAMIAARSSRSAWVRGATVVNTRTAPPAPATETVQPDALAAMWTRVSAATPSPA